MKCLQYGAQCMTEHSEGLNHDFCTECDWVMSREDDGLLFPDFRGWDKKEVEVHESKGWLVVGLKWGVP